MHAVKCNVFTEEEFQEIKTLHITAIRTKEEILRSQYQSLQEVLENVTNDIKVLHQLIFQELNDTNKANKK